MRGFLLKGVLWLIIAMMGAVSVTSAMAEADYVALKNIDINTLENNELQVVFYMSKPANIPVDFSIETPPKIILDFEGVVSEMSKDKSRINFNVGSVRRATVVQGKDRTRVVIDLNAKTPYSLIQEGDKIILNLSSKAAANNSQVKRTPFNASAESIGGNYAIAGVDFRRGSQQEGRIIVDLSDPNVPIDLKEEGNKIIVRYLNTSIPANLERNLDVTDFGTPVNSVNTVSDGKDVKMVIDIAGFTENMAYQADNKFTVEIRPLTRREKEKVDKESFEYTGERLSLNFQDIEVRAVLQLIADFTGLNIVTSDTVRGNVTLRLRNVPWDQALAIILKTKGLDKRQIGNVMMIGPSEELAAREKLELQTNQQVEELAPLRSEFIQINYARAVDVAALLKDENNSLLSARGSASVDERTNTLLVQDTLNKLDEIRALVHRLDVPVRQVLIESRVVFANDDFEDALGVNFGGALKFRPGNEPVIGFTKTLSQASSLARQLISPSDVPVSDRLNVNLPASPSSAGGNSGSFGLTIARLPGGTVLDLELMALEAEGKGKIVASPRLVTSNQQQAYIESGEEIPYLEATSSGAAVTAFKKAVLRLEVTPQITPDDHIILDLTVNQDSRGAIITSGGAPAIDTREIHTKVLVGNGETVVLGGIYQQTKKSSNNRVPFLGRLPFVGWLFRNEINTDNRNELMIFVTPKIVQEGMV